MTAPRSLNTPATRAVASALADLLVAPRSYRYHAALGGFLRLLNEKLARRSIALYAGNSEEQFESGAVYEYKEVVRQVNDELTINPELARARISEIFLDREILQILGLKGQESLLEVGCEAGQNLAAIHAALPELKLAGCDISPRALATAEKAGVSVKKVNLLEIDALAAYGAGQFDYVLVSHVIEHLVRGDVERSYEIRKNVLKHIHRIAKVGYVFTAPLLSVDSSPTLLSFLGHSRVALLGFPSVALNEIGVPVFAVKVNKQDESLSVIVKK